MLDCSSVPSVQSRFLPRFFFFKKSKRQPVNCSHHIINCNNPQNRKCADGIVRGFNCSPRDSGEISWVQTGETREYRLVSSVNCPHDEIERFYPVHSCKLRQTMEPSVVLGSSSHQRLSGVGLWTAIQPTGARSKSARSELVRAPVSSGSSQLFLSWAGPVRCAPSRNHAEQ